MNKKKTLLIVLAMVLVCALSVMGTMAMLAEERGAVINTFVASGGPGPFVDEDGFSIKEYKATADAAGNYSLDENTEVDANSYDVVPGVTLAKDAFVKLSRTNSAPAYLFVEVVNNLDTDIFTMNVDTTVWGKLDGVTGKNGGELYVLGAAANPTVLGAVSGGEYHIIKDNEITVADTEDLNITENTNDTVKFYAYICQATVADANGENTSVPAEVFDICF